MARTVIINVKRQTRTPYLRGIMTRSLQKAGLSFDKAHLLASNLRNEIGQLEEITTFELRDLVIRMLEEQNENSVCQRYQTGGNPDHMLLVRGPDQHALPFSRGIHQKSLERVGIPAQQARTTTTRLYHEIQATGVAEIGSTRLGHLTYQTLLKKFGEKSARRYLLWSAFNRSDRPLIILIGGVPGCGKSAVSMELATRMEIVRTQSTDLLREVMRMMIPERLLPVLHTSSFNAWEVLSENSVDSAADRYKVIAQGYSAQAQLLSVPCEAVISRAMQENVSLIMEGVHLQPTLIRQLPVNDSAILVPVLLAVLKPEELRDRISMRDGLVPQHQAVRYLRHFDDIWQLQSLLLAEADQLAVPIINSKHNSAAVKGIMDVIFKTLEREFGIDAETVFGEMPDHSMV